MKTIASTIDRPDLTQRERELGAIISAYNEVTEQLKQSHDLLRDEVVRLREELVRKNRQLQRRERLAALGEMAAGVAHEIRNPLGGIRLFASLLEKDLRHLPASQRLATKIARGVGTVEAIVTDFLEFGRPRDPQPQPLSVEAVLRETIELAASKTADSGVQVMLAEGSQPIEMVSDAGMIRRGVLNLVLNAVEAAASGRHEGKVPEVKVSYLRHDSGQVMLSVTDNGPGVPAELMDRIFNPFFTTKDRGMGLGLAIVHQIAESLGGSVQAVNRPEGGVVFSLQLAARMEQQMEMG